MFTVDLVWFNAGGGHRAAAQALEQGLWMQGSGVRARKLNLVEVLDPTAAFKRYTGLEPEDLYNKRLASGFTLGLAQELKLLQRLIRSRHELLVQRLARHWSATAPDMVVSLIPNFNRALHDGLAQARPGAPFVTVLTDLADHPPNFWIEPTVRQHVVCGTQHAVHQAQAAGVDAARVHRVHGMLLRPEFHRPPRPDRTERRLAAGLDAHTPTGLVMFGGQGARVMRRIARELRDRPLILMCGRHEALAEVLRREAEGAPHIVVGHTDDVAGWMQRADYFIGKPGPGALSEAVSQGLPVIVTRNAWTMPQERWNTQWVAEQGLGLVLSDFSEVRQGVSGLLLRLDAFRERVRRVENHALFEVPRLLHRIAQAPGVSRAEAALSSA